MPSKTASRFSSIKRYWPTIVMVALMIIPGYDIYDRHTHGSLASVSTSVPWQYGTFLLLIALGIGLTIGRFTAARSNASTEDVDEILEGLPKQTPTETSHEPANPITIGLTLDSAELDIAMNDPDPNPGFKCKLRVYWTNDGDETIHLGKPLWIGGAIQGNELVAHYQLRQFQNTANPWGRETEETDITPGRRCRIWLGLSPTLRENAAKLLDTGELGLLTIPVSTSNWSVNLRLRPRDRGLKQFNAQEYLAQRKAVYDRYSVLSQQGKELLGFLCARRILSTAELMDHFQKYDLPDAEKTLASLRSDSVPFLATSDANEIKVNPLLEKVIVEIVKADSVEFLKAVEKMTGEVMGVRIKNEPGFKGRYNALSARPLNH